MPVIIKKENGKIVYNTLNVSKEDRFRAENLDKALSELIPQIEGQWIKKRMDKKRGRRTDIKLVYKISKQLSKIIDNEKLVLPNEKKWVWKAIRSIYLKTKTFSKRGETRDDLEYIYRVSKYPYDFLEKISWDGWRRLLDYQGIRDEQRLVEWLLEKTKTLSSIKRGFIRKFTKNLYALVKNKDTSVLSNEELFAIYEKAWAQSLNM